MPARNVSTATRTVPDADGAIVRSTLTTFSPAATGATEISIAALPRFSIVNAASGSVPSPTMPKSLMGSRTTT
jgi:hypothetical protein